MAVRMPSFFIPHGAGPGFFMAWQPPDTWDSMRAFLAGLPAMLPARPRAILLVSAHWVTPDFALGSGAHPGLIYDYSGFPPHTYQLDYGAPGDPALAEQARGLLEKGGLRAAVDAGRGFDHGVFIPLKVAFPAADIPVVPLSIRADLDAAAHVRAGAALAGLRQAGVLIIGSGMSFHNMPAYGDPAFGPVSKTFDDWLVATVAEEPEVRGALLGGWTAAPAARLCHPAGQEEHLLPLMVAAGASDGTGQRVFSAEVLETTLSGFRFD
jgi:aromatic ring-opening dioxygenase catalytic subunit (LigB family)